MKHTEFVTITLNPAIDQTLFVEGLLPGTVHRATRSHRQAGGKGINVATMLSLGGAKVSVTGFLGAENPGIFERHFRRYELADHFLRVDGETRTGIKVVDTQSDDTTDFNLPGPRPTELQQRRLIDKVHKLASHGKWVVISGSLPQGVEAAFLVELIKTAHSHGAYVAVDSSGDALKAALAEGVEFAKPNRDELAEYLGAELSRFRDAMEAARDLRRSTVPNLVVSLGGEGALFLTPDAELMAGAPKAKVVSTVGAGDSLLAGFLLAHASGHTPAECAKLATVYAWNRLESLTPSLSNGDVLQEQMSTISVQPLTSFDTKAVNALAD